MTEPSAQETQTSKYSWVSNEAPPSSGQVHTGMVQKRHSWEEVVDIVNSGQPNRFGRLPEQMDEYKTKMSLIREQYSSIEDYLLYRIFNFKTESKDGKLVAIRPEVVEKQVLFVPNDFPYALDDGIEHYILWSTYILKEDEVELVLKEKCKGNPFCYFVNPPSIRSIKSIYHAHVMYLKK